MNKLTVSPSPHLMSTASTAGIMKDVVIALIPALLAGICVFGYRALVLAAACVASCVLFEYLSMKAMKRPNSTGDFSAVVTGLLIALNLPVTMPVWMAVLGCAFAIVAVKQIFGGLGQNFANPAICGRIFLFVAFSTQMSTWVKPFWYLNGVDAVTSPTPLQDIAAANTWDLFIGNIGGCIGEVSALALILGGIYLVYRRIITPTTPLVYLGTLFVLTTLSGQNGLNHILSGGVMLGAIFMATDYTTTPSTKAGKVLFAFGCGLITYAIRVFGSYPEGVSFAILFMNILAPLIDRITKTKPFGMLPKPKKEKAAASK